MARPLQHSMQGVCVSQLFSTNCCLHFKCSLRLKLVHHPTKSTWNLNMEVWKVKFLFKGIDSYSEVPCSFSWERNAVAAAQPIRQPKDKSHTVQIQYDPSVKEIKQLQCHKVFFTMQQGPFIYQLKWESPSGDTTALAYFDTGGRFFELTWLGFIGYFIPRQARETWRTSRNLSKSLVLWPFKSKNLTLFFETFFWFSELWVQLQKLLSWSHHRFWHQFFAEIFHATCNNPKWSLPWFRGDNCLDATASGKCKLARPAKRQRKPKNLQEIEAGKVPIYGAKVVPIRIVISPWGLTCDIFRPCEAKKSKLVKIGGRKARLNWAYLA